MILCDTNVWMALSLSEHPHHRACADWLESVQEPVAVRFCRATQQGMLRLLTTGAVLARYGDTPLTNEQAWRTYRELADDDRVGPLATEPVGLEDVWSALSTRNTASPKLWMDSYLAAFAIAGAMTFVTIDAAFQQFAELDLHLIG